MGATEPEKERKIGQCMSVCVCFSMYVCVPERVRICDSKERERERESEAYIGDVLFVTEVKEGTLAM